jgi:hypothetical protein
MKNLGFLLLFSFFFKKKVNFLFLYNFKIFHDFMNSIFVIGRNINIFL